MTETNPRDAPNLNRRPSYFDNAATRARYGLDTAGTPPLPPTSPGASAPGTPRGQLGRPLSGSWNSPGGSFRADDEVFVLELGARYVRLGFGGENTPRALVSFGPESRTRLGDYNAWLPSSQGTANTKGERPEEEDVGSWGADQQLYPLDLRSADMNLISLQLERSIRLAASQQILAIDDSKRRVIALAIQPQLPLPLLKEVLDTLFAHYPSPYQIAVLSTPLCSTVAAGLRNALVVDIGWNETVVSSVYEMRELEHRRSERGMRRLNWETSKLLVQKLDERDNATDSVVTFEDSEEVVWRMCHCRSSASSQLSDKQIPVFLPSQQPPKPLSVAFDDFAQPVEKAFFGASPQSDEYTPSDDNLGPLPQLIHTSLLRLPPDVRGTLISRILVTGGGAHIPRMRTRLLSELEALIRTRGWDPVQNYGSAKRSVRIPVRLRNGASSSSQKAVSTVGEEHSAANGTNAAADQGDSTTEEARPSTDAPYEAIERVPVSSDVQGDDAETTAPAVTSTTMTSEPSMPQAPTNKDLDANSTTRAALQPQLPDEVLAKIQRGASMAVPPRADGAAVRGVRTLGAWAGASLLSGLRQRGIVEVDKDAFLAHGLAGAERDAERSVVEEAVKRRSREAEKRQSVLAGGKAGERKSGSWTLGAWA